MINRLLALLLFTILLCGCELESKSDLTRPLRTTNLPPMLVTALDAQDPLKVTEMMLLPFVQADQRLYDLVQLDDKSKLPKCVAELRDLACITSVLRDTKFKSTAHTVGFVKLADLAPKPQEKLSSTTVAYLLVVRRGERQYLYQFVWMDLANRVFTRRSLDAQKVWASFAKLRCPEGQNVSGEACKRQVRRYLRRHFDIQMQDSDYVASTESGLAKFIQALDLSDDPNGSTLLSKRVEGNPQWRFHLVQ